MLMSIPPQSMPPVPQYAADSTPSIAARSDASASAVNSLVGPLAPENRMSGARANDIVAIRKC